MFAAWKKIYDKPRQNIKKQRHHFADKGLYGQSCGSSIHHVWMWELYHKEDWVLKNWCFQTVVLEKTLESPLGCKEIKPANAKGNQPWRIDAEAKSSNTLATRCEELTHWIRPLCWEGLKAGGEEDNRGWDGWTASPAWWTWVWADSGRSWRTGKTGML